MCINFNRFFSFFFLTTSITFAQEEAQINEKYIKKIERLARNNKIKKAFITIKKLESVTIQRHIKLTEIEAPPFKEVKRAIAFADYFKQLGMDSVWIDKEGNVLGLFRGSEGKRTVALDAHLDTVFPEGTNVEVQIRKDTLYAPGIGDDTRGLAVLLTILETLKKTEIQPKDNILFIGSVGEEGLGDLRGIKYLFRDKGLEIDSWIAIDGNYIGKIINKALGSYRYRVSYKGQGGHSWGAFGLANPHHALGEAISNFVNMANQYISKGPKTSYNVGVIHGGTSINSIPFESAMQIDIRSLKPSRLEHMETLLKKATQKALDHQNRIKTKGPNLILKIDKIGNRPSGELSDSLALVQRALAAASYFNVTPTLARGSTNSNIPISKGIPSVTLGAGGKGGNVHSFDEWWINKEGFKAIQFSLLILLSETGME